MIPTNPIPVHTETALKSPLECTLNSSKLIYLLRINYLKVDQS